MSWASNARTMQDFFDQRGQDDEHRYRSCVQLWNDGAGAGPGWIVRAGGVLGKPAYVCLALQSILWTLTARNYVMLPAVAVPLLLVTVLAA